MSATAAIILRQLDARRAQAQIAALADMDDDAQDEVRRLLGAVKPSARVDIGKLVASVRESIDERRRAEASNMTVEQRAQFRDLIRAANERWREECLRRGVAVPSAGAYAVDLDLNGYQSPAKVYDAETLDDPGDSPEEARPRRRPIKRLRSKREARPQPEQDFYVGPKAFDQFGALTREPFTPMRPPWLLDDGDLEEPDDEFDDELDDDQIEENVDATAAAP